MKSSISTDGDDLVLGVARSVGARRWTRLLPPGSDLPRAIIDATGCHPILAKVLAGRGAGAASAASILTPSLRALMPDPSCLRGMDDAAGLLADLAEARATVGLFGDYDVDGAASSALMAHWLQALGARPILHIPDRIAEGYGPNKPAIDALVEDGIDALITLDCGATSHEALAHASKHGLSVLVLDHHQMNDLGPAVDALVNPNRPDDTSGLGFLCAAGVTFMALVAANRELRRRGHEASDLPDLLERLDLVALATIADVVPLLGLNRAFVAQGVKVAQRRSTIGLAALIDSARLTGPLKPYHFGFVLGPRINAGGRIGDAAMGARLLLTDDEVEARRLAGELDTLNAQRQAIEAEAVSDAIGRIEQQSTLPPVIILRDDTWHQGVVGLIAARLKERFNRPALAFTLASDGTWTGSARSVPGVDIGAAVHHLVAEGVARKGGGHPMAAGLSLDQENWQRAEETLTAFLEAQVTRQISASALAIDAVLTADAVSLDLIDAVERAAPYGTGFPEPVFAFASHTVRHAGQVGENHVKVRLAGGTGTMLDGIAFRALGTPLGDALLAARDEGPVHIAGSIVKNSWQGRDTPQLRILDVAQPGSGE